MKRLYLFALGIMAGSLAGNTAMAAGQTADATPAVQATVPEDSAFHPDVDIEAAAALMEMAQQAEIEKRYGYSRNYYKEAFRLNPYNDYPLMCLEQLNLRIGHGKENKEMFRDGMALLMERAQSEGIHPATVSTMEQLMMGVLRADENDVESRYQVLWLCNEAGLPEFGDLALALMDDLIFLVANDKNHRDIYAYAVVSKMFSLDNAEEMRRLLEPAAKKLVESENGVCGLVVLSLIYQKKGKAAKAEKYLEMARSADPTGEAVDSWLNRLTPLK